MEPKHARLVDFIQLQKTAGMDEDSARAAIELCIASRCTVRYEFNGSTRYVKYTDLLGAVRELSRAGE